MEHLHRGGVGSEHTVEILGLRGVEAGETLYLLERVEHEAPHHALLDGYYQFIIVSKLMEERKYREKEE